MPIKEDVLKSLDESNKKSYSAKEVKAIVNSVKNEVHKPTELKKGDIYTTILGVKKRPVVICRINGDIVFGIPISSTEDEMNAMKFKSRFCGENYFNMQIVTSTYEHAIENFSGIFDNDDALDEAVKLISDFIVEQFKKDYK